MRKYFIKSFEEARSDGLLGLDWVNDDGEFHHYDYEYRKGLFLQEGDGPATLIQTDGGEPEDYSFTRDLSWIPGALNEAYTAGYSAGLDDERV